VGRRGTSRTAILFAFATVVGAGATTAGVAAGSCPWALTQGIPARSASAETGSEFIRQTAALSESERESAIGAELLAGNLPEFLRHLKPVTLRGRDAAGRTAEITICVTPDYLAVGSDAGFLSIPMGLRTAFAVAASFGFVLPTPTIVDAIYEQAEFHLRPQPLPPGPEMRSNGYYWEHQQRVREQRLALHAPLGALMAGQKKDLVVTNRLWRKAGRVAIYGWHRGAGAPIQPLSTVHGARYADYSHGVRLVSALAYVDGQARSIFDVLQDPWLAAIVSDEGPIIRPANLIAAAPAPGEQAHQNDGCTVTACGSRGGLGNDQGGPQEPSASPTASQFVASSVLQQRKPRW
jgi:hypothetical protein